MADPINPLPNLRSLVQRPVGSSSPVTANLGGTAASSDTIREGVPKAAVSVPTVADELDTITSKNSPLMDQTRSRAMRAASRGGLQNTSMAVQAGEEAVIAQALPIAQQDAGHKQALDMAGFEMSGNLQGMYAQHTSQIMDRATQEISDIATATGIDSATKNAMIANIQADRDASLAFIGSLYEQLPVWDPSWPLLGGTGRAPTAGGGGTGSNAGALPPSSGAGGAGGAGGGGGSSGVGSGGAVGIGTIAGLGSALLDSDFLDDLFGGGADAGGGGFSLPPGAGTAGKALLGDIFGPGAGAGAAGAAGSLGPTAFAAGPGAGAAVPGASSMATGTFATGAAGAAGAAGLGPTAFAAGPAAGAAVPGAASMSTGLAATGGAGAGAAGGLPAGLAGGATLLGAVAAPFIVKALFGSSSPLFDQAAQQLTQAALDGKPITVEGRALTPNRNVPYGASGFRVMEDETIAIQPQVDGTFRLVQAGALQRTPGTGGQMLPLLDQIPKIANAPENAVTQGAMGNRPSSEAYDSGATQPALIGPQINPHIVGSNRYEDWDAQRLMNRRYFDEYGNAIGPGGRPLDGN